MCRKKMQLPLDRDNKEDVDHMSPCQALAKLCRIMAAWLGQL